MPRFWEFGNKNSNENHRKLQDGLFQIASQTCNLLVQVNNTNNISYGGSSTNIVTNNGPSFNNFPTQIPNTSKNSQDDDQFMVLLPQNGRSTMYKPILKSKSRLSTVLENISFSQDDNQSEIAPNFSYRDDDVEVNRWRKQRYCKPSYIPISLILILIVLVVLLPLLDHAMESKNIQKLFFNNSQACSKNYKFSLVESIPEGLNYPDNSPKFPSTYSSWLALIDNSEESIDIASFYWTLRDKEPGIPSNPSSKQGEDIFNALLKAGTDRKIKIRIAQNSPSQSNPNVDTEIFVKKKAAEVRSLNFAQLLGSGVLHTKFWIVDKKHVYIGSANMDWRALTQVKEMGIIVNNCSCLAEDLMKIFEVYWSLGVPDAKVPSKWPAELETSINMDNPISVINKNETYKAYITSSPLAFNPAGRTNDIDALVNVIHKAEKYIYISVMDYFPLMIYKPKLKFWPIIDDALRTASIEHKVHIKMLISWWKHSRKSEDNFLKSLQDLNKSYPGVNIEIRRFIVPSTPEQEQIPYGRVNHNKYMVTDNSAFIGTSNWSGDYFTDTAGVSFIVEDFTENDSKNETQKFIRDHLKSVFDRDWASNYSFPLDNYPITP